MVDYTKDAMRDETWRRWKGGTKLAEDLRNFYTNPRVFARLAAQNPMGPSTPAATGTSWKQDFRNQWLRRMFAGGGPMRLSAGGRQLMMQKLGGMIPGEDKERAAARQSGATLPGR